MSNDNNKSVELAVKSILTDALTQLTALWQKFGLNEDERLQQKKLLIATIKQRCQRSVSKWRRGVDRAVLRIAEQEKEVQTSKAQFQGNESANWCIQSLDQLCCNALRDRLAALEIEFKFFDSIRIGRLVEVTKIHDYLSLMDKKLGTTSVMPSDVPILSENYKATLQKMARTRTREVHTRRAALLEAVSECVQLTQELQIEAGHTFAADINCRLTVS